MNLQIEKLYQIANKSERLIIGLMSGTSLDGLDIALCKFLGQGLDTQVELVAFETVSYDPSFKEEIKAVFAKEVASLEKVCLLNPWVAKVHAQMILQVLSKWGVDSASVDLIASHGQTIYHAPARQHQQQKFGNATLQIGDGDHLAVDTGIITVSDFRQKHIAAGGEGAPLAVYGDYLIFSKRGEDRILLNIGGIANFTFLPGNLRADEVFSTDVGPGNTLMDALIQKHFPEKYFDENAAIARVGKCHTELLHELKQNPFFNLSFLKTTGPEVFNLAYLERAQQKTNTLQLTVEDCMTTLNQLTADTIVDAMKKTISNSSNPVIYSSGGGMHNPLLMERIQSQLKGARFLTTTDLGINPDAKEAVLFATLANESICGGGVSFGRNREGIPSVSMGKISFPG
ncbi:MAG: anhydro-N-acetylmuramic acid kinase [Flammeovirgaceae bacterium]|nr:anhydro-N-acetylmuramic acid kinase [Flammeovirgaceae bacterium]